MIKLSRLNFYDHVLGCAPPKQHDIKPASRLHTSFRGSTAWHYHGHWHCQKFLKNNNFNNLVTQLIHLLLKCSCFWTGRLESSLIIADWLVSVWRGYEPAQHNSAQGCAFQRFTVRFRTDNNNNTNHGLMSSNTNNPFIPSQSFSKMNVRLKDKFTCSANVTKIPHFCQTTPYLNALTLITKPLYF